MSISFRFTSFANETYDVIIIQGGIGYIDPASKAENTGDDNNIVVAFMLSALN